MTTHDGEAAVRSGDISHGESSILQTSVLGPGQGEFYWKVSSEASYDWLIFSIDDVEFARISGEVDWTRRDFSVPAGPHTLTWRYQKDMSASEGRDAAWLDQFAFFGTELRLVNPRVTGTTFSLTVTSVLGRTYTLEYKTNLNSPVWTPLIGVQGNGLPLLLLDTNANDSQRFYRVRVE